MGNAKLMRGGGVDASLTTSYYIVTTSYITLALRTSHLLLRTYYFARTT